MAGFSKMLAQASLGALWLVTKAPVDKPFDMNHFEGYEPSSHAIDWCFEKGLIKEIGPAIYQMTAHGIYFRNYVNGELTTREAVSEPTREPLYA